MSWQEDFDLREAIEDVAPTGALPPDRRLYIWPRRTYQSHGYWQHLGIVTPLITPELTGSTATYEAHSVAQVYYQDYTARTTMSLSDFLFVGTTSITSFFGYFYPPLVAIPWPWDLLDNVLGWAATAGVIHVVTREGWRISGTSYPSYHFTIQVT